MSKERSDSKNDGPLYPDGDQRYESARGWNEVSVIENLIREEKKKYPKAYAKDPDLFYPRPMQDWMELAVTPPPEECLFGPFWRVGELAVLFGGTGTGKSALATQIADSIARGHSFAPFNTAEYPAIKPQQVLYFDFELNMSQLAMRYALIDGENKKQSFVNRYEFASFFHRTEMCWNGQVIEGYDGFSDMFFRALDKLIYSYRPSVIIVDNITFLDRTTTSNASTALNIMRNLQDLKYFQQVSILVLAHTPKRRPWIPLTELDLQGSINLANFADSIFALGRSRSSTDMRYLKQVKVRTGRPIFNADNVPVFVFEKYDFAAESGRASEGEERKNFLGFRFEEFGHENDHLDTELKGLRENSRRKKRDLSVVRAARKLAKAGKSSAAIGAELGIPKATAHRYAKSA